MDAKPKDRVTQLLRDLMATDLTRSELVYLLARADDVDAMTWPAALGVLLQDVGPSLAPKAEAEVYERYVRRIVTYFISKQSERGMASALDAILSDMESLRSEHQIADALAEAFVWNSD